MLGSGLDPLLQFGGKHGLRRNWGDEEWWEHQHPEVGSGGLVRHVGRGCFREK